VGLAEILAAALVFGQQNAFPEQLEEAVAAAEVLDRFVEAGQMPAAESEDAEEFVPEGLGFRVFARL
jgi:hypothetical protein